MKRKNLLLTMDRFTKKIQKNCWLSNFNVKWSIYLKIDNHNFLFSATMFAKTMIYRMLFTDSLFNGVIRRDKLPLKGSVSGINNSK